MANQKMWNRNYDNLFSQAFGWKGNSEQHSLPTEEKPMFRRASDGAYFSGIGDNGISNGIAMSCASLNAISSYLTNTNSTISWANTVSSSISGFKSGWSICLGSGNEPPLYEGYNLLTPIYSNMTLGTVTLIPTTYDSVNHSYTYGYKIPIAYSGTNDVVINEFGLYVPIVVEADRHLVGGYPMMIYHEVFETGIILHQNDTLEITITQTVIQPNYTPYPSTE